MTRVESYGRDYGGVAIPRVSDGTAILLHYFGLARWGSEVGAAVKHTTPARYAFHTGNDGEVQHATGADVAFSKRAGKTHQT